MKPNLKIIENFIPNSEELFLEIKDTVEWDVRMKARKTASFGVSYDYSGITYPQTEMPKYLMDLCKKIHGSLGFLPNNCLMNYYTDGSSSMGFHSDNSEELEKSTGVAIVSLGSQRHITYRLIENKEHKVKYALPPGVLLYMGKDVQDEWQHSIPKEKGVGERISLTFRQILKSVT